MCFVTPACVCDHKSPRGQSPNILPQVASAPGQSWVDPFAKVIFGHKIFYQEEFFMSCEALTVIYTYFLVSASE